MVINVSLHSWHDTQPNDTVLRENVTKNVEQDCRIDSTKFMWESFASENWLQIYSHWNLIQKTKCVSESSRVDPL